ncbi:MAG: AmpG family muropeptide MFS transporter [Nostocaceae cyanobacterium]|nr:AmpG family muropeptide MFS transporter [Nostocaceae cyanobacterium]
MQAIQSFLKVFESRKMAAVTLLGFSGGLPLLLTGSTLQAWMTKEGVSLGSIGLFGLVTLPYSIKFLWSPFLDRFTLPFLGRRRGWLMVTQIGLLIAIALMALQQPKQALQLLAINALLIAILSATQDIVIDAYRVDVLDELEKGAGAAVYVAGYRVAMILVGAFGLMLADRIPWSSVYLVMAAFMVVGILATLIGPEPKQISPPESLVDAVILPFGEFFQRQGILQAVLTLLFIVLYRLGDTFLGRMSTPFLLQTGFSQTQIGAIQGGMGIFASIVGALVGGVIVSRIGINRSLWVFGILQAASNLAYFLIAIIGKNDAFLVLAINIEQFCGGLAVAGFVAFMMNICNQRFSASQYALLTSFMNFSGGFLSAPIGFLAESTGWQTFFLISIAAAVPGLLLLPLIAPWNPKLVTVPRPGLEEEI